jgi:hypothetical protein
MDKKFTFQAAPLKNLLQITDLDQAPAVWKVIAANSVKQVRQILQTVRMLNTNSSEGGRGRGFGRGRGRFSGRTYTTLKVPERELKILSNPVSRKHTGGYICHSKRCNHSANRENLQRRFGCRPKP